MAIQSPGLVKHNTRKAKLELIMQLTELLETNDISYLETVTDRDQTEQHFPCGGVLHEVDMTSAEVRLTVTLIDRKSKGKRKLNLRPKEK